MDRIEDLTKQHAYGIVPLRQPSDRSSVRLVVSVRSAFECESLVVRFKGARAERVSRVINLTRSNPFIRRSFYHPAIHSRYIDNVARSYTHSFNRNNRNMTDKTQLDQWEFSQVTSNPFPDVKEEWHSCEIPTSVHVELIKLNKIPHPFKGLKEWNVQCESMDWVQKLGLTDRGRRSRLGVQDLIQLEKGRSDSN